MIKVNKEYILNLDKGNIYIVYNPLTDKYKEEVVSDKDIAKNKYCYDKLEFYIEENNLFDKLDK